MITRRLGSSGPEVLREALQGRDRDQVVLSVKFGVLRDPTGGSAGSTAARRP